MRNKLILILASMFVFATQAQKVDDRWVKFEYIRLPLKPLDPGIKSYQSKVISWEDQAAESMHAQYEKDLEDYRKNYKLAQDQYQKELEEYNSKSRLEKVLDKELLDEEKPVFNPPPYPELNIPKSPDNESLASKYLSLDGYENGNFSPVFITVELKVFDIGESEAKTKTTGSGENQKTTTTYYTKYKQPVKLTLEDVLNGVIYDDVLPVSTEWYTYSSKTKPTYEEVKKFALNDLMSYTGKYINSNYGRTTMSLNTSVVTIRKHRKYKYGEFEQAAVYAMNGYKNLLHDRPKAISEFNKAINIWEKQLESYDPNNSKARINRDVAWYTMLNVGEAYLWIDDFEKADEYFSRMEMVMPKWSDKSRFMSSKERVREHRERFLANQ